MMTDVTQWEQDEQTAMQNEILSLTAKLAESEKQLAEAMKDAERWAMISTLMFIGNVELNQDEDGGYSISVDPVENLIAKSWSGNSPEEAIDAARSAG